LRMEAGDTFGWLVSSLISYGYLGVFSIGLLSNLMVFVVAPYALPLVLLSPVLDPNLLALSNAIGSTVGKAIVFRASYLGYSFISEERKRKLRPFKILIGKYGWVAAFVAAATPIPDDLIYIPMGFMKYDFWKFFASTFAGKLVLSLIIVWGSRFSYGLVDLLGGGGSGVSLEGTLALLAIALATFYITLKLDWNKVLPRLFPNLMKEGEAAPS